MRRLIAGAVTGAAMLGTLGGLTACSDGTTTVYTPTPVQPASSAPHAPAPSAAGIGVYDTDGDPAGDPLADITAGPCGLSWSGDPSVGNLYYTARSTLQVTAPGQISIESADLEVIGSGGAEIGSLTVAPVMGGADEGDSSENMEATSGTVPVTWVADQNALSGAQGATCKVISVTYGDES
jgi:hypothetical protein